VYEKVAQCNQYPPDGEVTFYDIKVEVGGKDVTNQISWTTAYVEDVCDNRAHILNSTSIQITWNTKLDNGRDSEPIDNLNTGKNIRRAGMAYREEPPMKKEEQRQAGMAYREEPPRRQAGMAYREEAPLPRKAGMAYREEAPLPRKAGMAYREEAPLPRKAGMRYREM
jgi:hypothetical protein